MWRPESLQWTPNRAAVRALRDAWSGNDEAIEDAYWHQDSDKSIYAFIMPRGQQWRRLGFTMYQYDPATESCSLQSVEFAVAIITWAGANLPIDLMRRVVRRQGGNFNKRFATTEE